MLNMTGNYFIQHMTVCLHYWRATVANHNCMPGCESILAVTASWLICVWILFMWYQKLKVSCMVVLMDEGILNLLQRCWVERAGPIFWPGKSWDRTLIYVFWSNVTEHICIRPFGIPLKEGNWNWTCFGTYSLLGFYSSESGNSISAFWDNQSVPYSRVKMSKKNGSR